MTSPDAFTDSPSQPLIRESGIRDLVAAGFTAIQATSLMRHILRPDRTYAATQLLSKEELIPLLSKTSLDAFKADCLRVWISLLVGQAVVIIAAVTFLVGMLRS